MDHGHRSATGTLQPVLPLRYCHDAQVISLVGWPKLVEFLFLQGCITYALHSSVIRITTGCKYAGGKGGTGQGCGEERKRGAKWGPEGKGQGSRGGAQGGRLEDA